MLIFIVTYLSAFVSVFFEISPLIGTDGLLPAKVVFNKWRQNGVDGDMSKLPTIFWWSDIFNKYIVSVFPQLSVFDAYDNSLHLASLIGITLSLLATISNKFVNFFTFFILWIIYLSTCIAGQLFFQFQWDSMLCEVGFIAMFFCPTRSNGEYIVDEISSVVRDLLKWVTFRLNFASGVAKLTSGCQTWWNLTALHHHFQTQPLPTPLAWYFHQLPSSIKKLFVAQNFVTLIGASLMLYVPYRRFRIFGMMMLLSEQIMIIITGNYNFFNFLTSIVTLCASDDQFITFIIPKFILKALGAQEVILQEEKEKQDKLNKYKKPIQREIGDSMLDQIISVFKFITECLVFVNITPLQIQNKTKRLQIPIHFILFSKLALIIFVYYKYFPLDSIFGEAKLPFDVSDIKINLINGPIPIVVLVVAILYCINNLFHYSIENKTKNKIKRSATIITIKRLFSVAFAFVVFMSTSYMFFAGLDKQITFFPLNIPALQNVGQMIHPFQVANSYGLFRRMTGIEGREEFVFEVSSDGKKYHEIDLVYKPGKLNKAPKFSIPYHPRLDWQLWFSAMKDYINEAYLANLIFKLVENKKVALSLFENSPLLDKEIKYVSIIKYKYWFTSEEEAKVTGNWWKREKVMVIGEHIKRGQNTLEESLSMFHIPIDKKKYELHPFRSIPVLPIIWSVLLIGLISNLLKNPKK